VWGRTPVCRLAGPTARSFDATHEQLSLKSQRRTRAASSPKLRWVDQPSEMEEGNEGSASNAAGNGCIGGRGEDGFNRNRNRTGENSP